VNLESLRKHAAGRAGATVDLTWGHNECFCVGGRMFTIFGIERGRARDVAFKVDGDRFLEMTDRPGIVPAPYLARAHWVLVEDAKALPDGEARALVERSHALVAAKLPRRMRDAAGAGLARR
jgi:predicted DNA-binding protein (MmcQ/YjbR family)